MTGYELPLRKDAERVSPDDVVDQKGPGLSRGIQDRPEMSPSAKDPDRAARLHDPRKLPDPPHGELLVLPLNLPIPAANKPIIPVVDRFLTSKGETEGRIRYHNIDKPAS